MTTQPATPRPEALVIGASDATGGAIDTAFVRDAARPAARRLVP